MSDVDQKSPSKGDEDVVTKKRKKGKGKKSPNKQKGKWQRFSRNDVFSLVSLFFAGVIFITALFLRGGSVVDITINTSASVRSGGPYGYEVVETYSQDAGVISTNKTVQKNPPE